LVVISQSHKGTVNKICHYSRVQYQHQKMQDRLATSTNIAQRNLLTLHLAVIGGKTYECGGHEKLVIPWPLLRTDLGYRHIDKGMRGKQERSTFSGQPGSVCCRIDRRRRKSM